MVRDEQTGELRLVRRLAYELPVISHGNLEVMVMPDNEEADHYLAPFPWFGSLADRMVMDACSIALGGMVVDDDGLFDTFVQVV